MINQKETIQRIAQHHVKIAGVCKSIHEHALDALAQAPSNAANYNPIMVLVSTALAINSRWEGYAKPRVERFEKLYLNDFSSIADLDQVLDSSDANAFLIKYLDTNGGERNQKYTRLKALLYGFKLCKKTHKGDTDNEILENWASRVDVDQHKNDVFGSQKNIGPGTLKNMLLCMGKNVTKPDRQVIKVLNQDFGVNPCIASEFESFAHKLGVEPLYLDQVCFHYGRIKEIGC